MKLKGQTEILMLKTAIEKMQKKKKPQCKY